MSGDIGIGKLVTSPQARDAIHVAVAPVKATEMLWPGQPVRLVPGYEDQAQAAIRGVDAIGIVDPFLTEGVFPGQCFWMFLLPGTITSLRHDWTHPAFAEASAATATAAAAPTSAKEESEAWLRAFVARSDCPDYETVVAAACAMAHDPHEWDRYYLHFSGMDAHGNIPPEFWDHMEVVTGRKFLPEGRPEYFSCSC